MARTRSPRSKRALNRASDAGIAEASATSEVAANGHVTELKRGLVKIGTIQFAPDQCPLDADKGSKGAISHEKDRRRPNPRNSASEGRSAQADKGEQFNEAIYLRENPEVAEAVAEGHLPSASFHYRLFGSTQQTVKPRSTVAVAAKDVPANLDAAFISSSGALFLIGWIDDRSIALDRVMVEFDDKRYVEFPYSHFARFRRADAEAALGIKRPMHLGFCCLVYVPWAFVDHNLLRPRTVRLLGADSSTVEKEINPASVDDAELRDLMLGYIAGVDFAGNNHVERFRALAPALGSALIEHNRAITRSIVAGSVCERFDPVPRRFKGSLIICLYGKPEFQFIQNALFSAGKGGQDYEYIYVTNSPELIESLCRAALISKKTYGLNVSVVMLPGNAGFGAANNIAVRHARSRRIMIVNPDVFPMADDWATRHDQVIEDLPREQTSLFGARLFYADGSLMHAGMYIDVDWGTSVVGLEVRRQPMLRVEHFGKGAPKDFAGFQKSRAVAAVSGAFMSVDRSCFERLNGFAEDYIFGHYEDADLCLRAHDQGLTPWVHDLRFWHLEGKGATRAPHHEGASHVNRWLFTRTWHRRVIPKLIGHRTPSLTDHTRRAV